MRSVPIWYYNKGRAGLQCGFPEKSRRGRQIRPRPAVTKLENLGKEGYRLITDKGDEVDCTWLIAGPGRSGAEWFSNQCKELGIQLINNQVDIGVRVELPATVFEHITDVVYESKLVYRTKQYGDQVRTFCMNPYGHVVAENVEGINTVNGHSYSDPKLRSENTNFALLVSNRFTSFLQVLFQHHSDFARPCFFQIDCLMKREYNMGQMKPDRGAVAYGPCGQGRLRRLY